MRSALQIPVPLRRAIDADSLCRDHPCDSLSILGSFWPNSAKSFESRLVKAFKESDPVALSQPHISRLCEFYADSISRVLKGERFDWVARVLGSAEAAADRSRPQGLLVDVICARTGARDITHLFHRSGSRPPMRTVPRLSGPDALRARIRYVVQDLFIKPAQLGGSVLLVDDIVNTGASVRVYARALKDHAGVERVLCVNLAATRFARGKDGHGTLKLGLLGLERHPALAQVWVSSDSVFHSNGSCPLLAPRPRVEVRFVAERTSAACPRCAGR
jgi:hypothetical protein